MFRRLSIVFSAILFATAVQAQWQSCAPGTSVCQNTGNVGIGIANPSEALVVNEKVLAISGVGVNGISPAGYPYFAASHLDGHSTAMQLRSYFAGAQSASYIGSFGTLGTYISQNREPQDGDFVYAAASPNQHNAAQIVVGDTIRGRLFQVTAMKSAAIDVAGIPMHRPGTLIGKALEPLAGGQGEILVLLSLQ